MTSGEQFYMQPVFSVAMAVTFMVAIPWVQGRRLARWQLANRTAEGEDRQQARGIGLFLLRPEEGKTFHLFDLVGVLMVLLVFSSSLWFPVKEVVTPKVMELSDYQVNAAFQAFLAIMVIARLSVAPQGMKNALGLRPDNWVNLMWMPLVVILATWTVGLVLHFSGWSQWVESEVGGDMQAVVKQMTQVSSSEVKWWLIFSAIIVAPVCEELVFRGFIFGVLRDLVNPSFAIVLSGVFFGLVHSNLLSLPSLCFLGSLLALLYHLTRSIWAPILCHFLFNLSTVLIQHSQ